MWDMKATIQWKSLTIRQQIFVERYIAQNGNGTAAARAAGYKATYNSLRAIACQNLQKPLIRALVQASWQHKYADFFKEYREQVAAVEEMKREYRPSIEPQITVRVLKTRQKKIIGMKPLSNSTLKSRLDAKELSKK